MTSNWYADLEGWLWYVDVGRCDYCGEDVEIACNKDYSHEVDVRCPTCDSPGIMYSNGEDFWVHWD